MDLRLMILKKFGPHWGLYIHLYYSDIQRTAWPIKAKLYDSHRHRNLEYQPKRAIPSIENVFAFFERRTHSSLQNQVMPLWHPWATR